jgi:hypothetical protein
MRFFTPERYLRLGNLDNQDAFLAAQAEWERAIEKYQSHLTTIRSALPLAMRRLLDSVYLHDARVLDMWQEGTRKLTITLHPESAPDRLVVLCYSLAHPVKVRKGALPTNARSEPVNWLYDEVELGRSTGGNGRPRKGSKPQFVHNILLSNGWELRVQFVGVKVSRPAPLLPAALGEGAA